MKKRIDTTGKTFGKWFVLEEINEPYIKISERRKTKLKCKCRCQCGVIKLIDKTNILRGKSTGCLRCIGLKTKGKYELTGQTFGWLNVISQDHSKKTARFWLCKCRCENLVSVSTRNLLQNRRSACYSCQPKGYIFKHVINKIGLKKGWLHVKKFVGFKDVKGKNYPHYKVKCKCGNILIMSNIQINDRYSCGCKRKDRIGEKNPRAKLSNKDAELIRELRRNNPSMHVEYLGKMFKISRSQVQEIISERSYNE